MTNREWLNSLSDDELCKFIFGEEEFQYCDESAELDEAYTWGIVGLDFSHYRPMQPTPRLSTLKCLWTSSSKGFAEWLKKERKETKQQMKEDIKKERFTWKLGRIYAWNAKAFGKEGEALQKLGRLEDIEDELGIGLDVFHKLMKMDYCGDQNILYVKDGNKIVEVGILELDYCKKKIFFYKDKNYNDDYVYGFRQYGETWALTKEELQDKERTEEEE